MSGNDWFERMEEIREKVFECERKLLQLNDDKYGLESAVKAWEAKMISEISQMISESTGKPLFSSDKTRQAEVDRLKEEDRNFKELQRTFEDVTSELAITKLALNNKIEQLKNIRVYLQWQSIRHDDLTISEPKLTKAGNGSGRSVDEILKRWQ